MCPTALPETRLQPLFNSVSHSSSLSLYLTHSLALDISHTDVPHWLARDDSCIPYGSPQAAMDPGVETARDSAEPLLQHSSATDELAVHNEPVLPTVVTSPQRRRSAASFERASRLLGRSAEAWSPLLRSRSVGMVRSESFLFHVPSVLVLVVIRLASRKSGNASTHTRTHALAPENPPSACMRTWRTTCAARTHAKGT